MFLPAAIPFKIKYKILLGPLTANAASPESPLDYPSTRDTGIYLLLKSEDPTSRKGSLYECGCPAIHLVLPVH